MSTTLNLPIIIPLSKTKLVMMLLGSLAFVIICLWFIISPEQFRNTLKVTITGYSGLVVFSAFAIAIVVKLFNTRPGLVISDEGITDNASAVSAGLIPWEDITGLTVSQVQRQRFMMLMVKNPEDYIARQNNVFKRKIAQMNYKFYGSPVSISTNSLKYNFDKLHELITDRIEVHQELQN